MKTDLLQKAYRIFDPAPLQSDENDKDLYVDLDAVRGSAGVVKRMANKIRLSAKPTCQLLAGHRGSGKSTELRRLQNELDAGEDRIFAVFCEADEDIDRNDVDFPEVLVAIVRQMAVQLKERAGIDLKPGFLKDRWQRLKNLATSPVDFEKVDVPTGMLTFSAAIKSSPDARLELRRHLDRDASNWIDAANDLIGDAKLQLAEKDYRDLAIIVDDLDKIVVRDYNALGQCLFVHREAQLTAFKCHMVYTMPIALAYSAQERVIANLYAGNTPVVPMIKIATAPPENAPYAEGKERCREIVASRLRKIGAQETDVFEEGVVENVVALSGGQPRELMLLVRESLVSGGLPVTQASLDRAVRESRRAYARQFRAAHWPIIESVRSTGRFERNDETDQAVRELLDSRAILQYANDEVDEWYNVNPIVAVLTPPSPATPEKSST
ncbi:AAA family ATPase [Candidatus Sumerlaeota bacterium]|nr:AAA family ATPase [Candidatus Sumerlaeota bacterium]